MTNYQSLIKKLQSIQGSSDFSPSEIELIADALETIQFLEIIFKVRKQSFGEAKTSERALSPFANRESND